MTLSCQSKKAWSEEKADLVQELYDHKLLLDLKSVNEIGSKDPNLYIRPLQLNDFDKGYLELLKQLTTVGNISKEDFESKTNFKSRVKKRENKI